MCRLWIYPLLILALLLAKVVISHAAELLQSSVLTVADDQIFRVLRSSLPRGAVVLLD